MLDIRDFPTLAEFNLIGTAELVAEELDYFNGTGITAGADATIDGLEVEIYGRAYIIPAANLPADLVRALTEAVEHEIIKEYL